MTRDEGTAAVQALAVLGPTAVGKSALAYALARDWPLTVISVDSAQVYRHLDIGTGKPDAAQQAAVPHALIDLCEPETVYSAADFVRDARAAVAAASAAGRLPLLVGGTHLYFRALHRGLSPLPPADPALRERLQQALVSEGAAALHGRLQSLDPTAAARIHRNDPQRLLRALEVIELTGKPLSSQQQQPGPGSGMAIRALALLPPSRAALHQGIERRLDAMLAAGFLDEARRLRQRAGFDPALPAYRSVGYRQLFEHLDGRSTLPEARERALYATRQLAKRQLTWLRGESSVNAVDAGQAAELLQGWAARWFSGEG